MKYQILYDQNRIDSEIITQHSGTIAQIMAQELGYPKVKKLKGISYQNEDVFRAKTDRKQRLVYTYTSYQGEKTLLILYILDDHKYNKIKHQLKGETVIGVQPLEENSNKNSSAPKEKIENITMLPSVSYNQMTLVLDDAQQQAIQQKTPLLLAGVPGAGKTVLLYNLMIRAMDSNHDSEIQAGTTLFISQSESLLKTLKNDYQQSPLETRPTVQFSTWSQLLQAQYPDRKQVSEDEFSQFLKKSKLKTELPHEVHYELSLIAALGVDDYQKLASRQSYYSDNPSKKKALISFLQLWQNDLETNKLFDPMVTRLDPLKTPRFNNVFCDEAQNLPPVALLDFITYAKDKRIAICLDTEQCLLSSPFIHNCIKMLLQKHYGSYNAHALSRTWRCPPKIIAVAEHLMNKKHQLDSGNRRLYSHIQSAQPDGGVVTWLNDSVLEELSQHGKSASTVVLTELLSQGERERIIKSLGTNNILSSSQAIGLDFNIVILWKPITQNPYLWSLYQKWQTQKSFDVTLQELNALNALYVSITRSQNAVCIYETDKRALRFGEFLLGVLPLNQIMFSTVKLTLEEESKLWEKAIEHHLAEKRFDVARELMQFHLKMDLASIERRIRDSQKSEQKKASYENDDNSPATVQTLTPEKKITQSTDSKEGNQSSKSVEKFSKIESKQEASKPNNKASKKEATRKYIAGLLKNPSPTNLLALFAHKNAQTYLFDEPNAKGLCLFMQLAMNFDVDVNVFTELCIQYLQTISSRLTAELLTQSLSSNFTLLYYFSHNSQGCRFLNKLLHVNPRLADNMDPRMLLMIPTGFDKSTLYNLALYAAGRQFLSALIKFNPELGKKLPAEALFNIPKNTPELKNSSVFSWLAMSAEGAKLLSTLLRINPELFKNMPAKFLKLIQPGIYADEVTLTTSITSFVYLSENQPGRKFLCELLELNPELLKSISAEMLFRRNPQKPEQDVSRTPFALLANCVDGDGHQLLELIFRANPALFKAITPENLSLKNSLTKKKVCSPLLGLTGGKGLPRLLKMCPELAMSVTSEELYNVYENGSSGVAPFSLLCRDAGHETLERLFSANPALAKDLTGQFLTHIQPAAPGKKVYLSPLYLLSLSSAGIRVLNKLLSLNPQIAQDIMGAYLLFSHDISPSMLSSTPLFSLASDVFGCQFLDSLVTLNPDIKFSDKFLFNPLSAKDPTTLEQILRKNKFGISFLKKIGLDKENAPDTLEKDSALESYDNVKTENVETKVSQGGFFARKGNNNNEVKEGYTASP
ncbi:DNA/RNA helicase domain-containing protein [Legionella hackeliae]|uniref:Uncharacterized protein n=1 Tax=Legionella hackeliae TaxID=449 RepID=A0A0A8UUB5_LEGHA|nr:DNA/RNA helicase domain-containing protein [Legionella hackeliae]KTD14170.1 hypothetical protein Lhac_0482 [Legionella hackeliae]CEK10379.1 protein of unknown function [Legionella hackeliae]STX47114.1 Uncharacterized conserved protein (DUF2075) [Legionella hackeliae]